MTLRKKHCLVHDSRLRKKVLSETGAAYRLPQSLTAGSKDSKQLRIPGPQGPGWRRMVEVLDSKDLGARGDEDQVS